MREKLCLFFLILFVGIRSAAQSRTLEDITIISDTCQTRSPLVGKIELGQNYPDPFFPSEETAITYRVDNAFCVKIILFDSDKEKLYTFEGLPKSGGKLIIGSNMLSPGEYYYALFINGRMMQKRYMKVLDPITLNVIVR